MEFHLDVDFMHDFAPGAIIRNWGCDYYFQSRERLG